VAESNYLTPVGAKKLQDELRQLAAVERPKVVQEVADAAAQLGWTLIENRRRS